MSERDPAKYQAALSAAALVKSGMVVGLGSGTTASLTIRLLGDRRNHEALDFVGVPTSTATAELAQSLAIPLRELDEVDSLDLNLDGADEVDSRFRMIKGRGGALLREKIVVSSARRKVTIITAEKRVERLGATMPLPVEVSLFGLKHTEAQLKRLGASTSIRTQSDGTLSLTDGGNGIIDCRFAANDDPESLDLRLRRVAGVLDTGFFFGLCDLLVVGYADRVEQFEAPPHV
ncbi:ribose-5-phosphate isomerase RpiA [Singulisphaera sp. GP187]|uniref:ribose-5-phosphate isomerase RpiA n=1 Tax=Singulisphaera sp. GP187 TaxID=1882752 RepID=UPI0009413216|nr:ribose-5-phosphate isomerase RpiA [Singulisphaera sp. GP187]